MSGSGFFIRLQSRCQLNRASLKAWLEPEETLPSSHSWMFAETSVLGFLLAGGLSDSLRGPLLRAALKVPTPGQLASLRAHDLTGRSKGKWQGLLWKSLISFNYILVIISKALSVAHTPEKRIRLLLEGRPTEEHVDMCENCQTQLVSVFSYVK